MLTKWLRNRRIFTIKGADGVLTEIRKKRVAICQITKNSKDNQGLIILLTMAKGWKLELHVPESSEVDRFVKWLHRGLKNKEVYTARGSDGTITKVIKANIATCQVIKNKNREFQLLLKMVEGWETLIGLPSINDADEFNKWFESFL